MPVATKRESILAYLKSTTLPLIVGTGNYNLKPTTISRTFINPMLLDDADFPAVFILDNAPASYFPSTNKDYVSGSSLLDLMNGMIVNIVGCIKIDRQDSLDLDGALSTEINKIFSDIMIAMHSDIRLGTNCEAVVLVGSDSMQQTTESHGVGMVVMSFSIKYLFNPRASTPIT